MRARGFAVRLGDGLFEWIGDGRQMVAGESDGGVTLAEDEACTRNRCSTYAPANTHRYTWTYMHT